MPAFHEQSLRSTRLIVRIAIAVGIVFAIYFYAVYLRARTDARNAAADRVLLLLGHHDARNALGAGVAAEQKLGPSAELTLTLWAALMADEQKRPALLKHSFPYRLQDPKAQLAFSDDSRFLAIIDGFTITVWNAEDGTQVLNTQAGDRFVGYWRIGARHFGLLASYQYVDLVTSVIELPDTFRYSQPSKDAVTAVAPDGDWAYHAPNAERGRSDYPIKLINLHTGEKREVDAGYQGKGAVAVNGDATRIAAQNAGSNSIELWDSRRRLRLAHIADLTAHSLYFSDVPGLLIAATARDLRFFDPDNGRLLFTLPEKANTVAVDPRGWWFAEQAGNTIRLYRGPASPFVADVAKQAVSPAPATSH
ncbi:MAG TPA: hypothetical protein VGG10_00845 [Rhizomicrobium sp.]|jgi:WD40 repeat protein